MNFSMRSWTVDRFGRKEGKTSRLREERMGCVGGCIFTRCRDQPTGMLKQRSAPVQKCHDAQQAGYLQEYPKRIVMSVPISRSRSRCHVYKNASTLARIHAQHARRTQIDNT